MALRCCGRRPSCGRMRGPRRQAPPGKAAQQQLKLLSRHDLAEFDEKLDAKARKDAYEQRLAVNVSGCQRIWRCYITRKRYMESLATLKRHAFVWRAILAWLSRARGRLQQQREGGRLAELQRRFAADVLQRMAWAQPENVQHLLRDGACPFCSKPGPPNGKLQDIPAPTNCFNALRMDVPELNRTSFKTTILQQLPALRNIAPSTIWRWCRHCRSMSGCSRSWHRWARAFRSATLKSACACTMPRRHCALPRRHHACSRYTE